MTPAPIAGGAGTLGSYQQQYLFAYILNKPPSFLPLYNSMIDNPNAPAALLPLITAAPLAFSDRVQSPERSFQRRRSCGPIH